MISIARQLSWRVCSTVTDARHSRARVRAGMGIRPRETIGRALTAVDDGEPPSTDLIAVLLPAYKNDRPRSYLSRSDRVQFASTAYQQVGTARGCANPLTIPHQRGTPKCPERMRSSPTMRGNADYHRYRACKGRNVATVASLGHSTCRACDAEASRDTDGRWGLDAQRRGYRSRHGPAATAAFSGARFLRSEVFVFRPQSTGALELPAVRMDNGWQTVDPAASVADTA